MSSTSKPPSEDDNPPPPLTNEELTEEIYASRALLTGQDKKLAHLQFDLESFTRRHDVRTKKIEDSLAFLIAASQSTHTGLPPETGQLLRRRSPAPHGQTGTPDPIDGYVVTVLIDGGSTHNFIKPAVAEKLSLPVHEISPFRVFVGNGESLRCSYACLKTPISLQGNTFDIDLFILQVKGPDVILGVQWLQELGDVTKNYRNLTMKFDWEEKPIFLQGDGANPKQISYNNLFSLIGHEPECELFELVSSGLDNSSSITATMTPPPDARVQAVLDNFGTIRHFSNCQSASAEANRLILRSKQLGSVLHWSTAFCNASG
ncbi:hypothetical protein SASPL_126285 [Salvia splendens]|uniref:Uncharacterized protein n=1 Tax=Salvia splendens TaxID=180675 RepID=A0A8X8XGQ4_SALSN|nr:hypothetical protein SASPL_126285 [Salvia splendens]